MARIRTIKPEFPQSESMGRVSRDARLLFILLWPICDDEGRARGDSRFLARTLYPYDDGEEGAFKTTAADVDRWIDELEGEGCVVRYDHGGNTYVQVCNWLNHQKIDKPSKSKIPAFAKPSPKVANPREESSEDQGSGTKGSGTKDQGGGALSLAAQQQEAAFISLPSISGELFHVDPALVAEWQRCYPAVDVEGELRKMWAWLDANASNRKTMSGMKRFCVNWLGKAQNKAPRLQGHGSANGQSAEDLADEVRRHLGGLQ